MALFTIDIPVIIAYNNRTINQSIGGDSLQYVTIESNPLIIVFFETQEEKSKKNILSVCFSCFFIFLNCTQTVLIRYSKSPGTRINAGFPSSIFLFKFGVSFVNLNYICLSFIQIHTAFYFNYINYSDLLIFCCQNVATPLL